MRAIYIDEDTRTQLVEDKMAFELLDVGEIVILSHLSLGHETVECLCKYMLKSKTVQKDHCVDTIMFEAELYEILEDKDFGRFQIKRKNYRELRE